MTGGPSMEDAIINAVQERGPLTGGELREALGPNGFVQWKTCRQSPRLLLRRVGKRYLRLDRKVEGYARLSPSILREFLTYSVVGLATEGAALGDRADALATRIEQIGEAKLRLARRLISEIGAQVLEPGATGAGAQSGLTGKEDRFCVLLAGDIVYGMAHDAPRPEKSTGRMVRGSDIDLVVLMDDQAPEELATRLTALANRVLIGLKPLPARRLWSAIWKIFCSASSTRLDSSRPLGW